MWLRRRRSRIVRRGALMGPDGVVAGRVTWCVSLPERLRGVLGRPPLEPDEAYVITDAQRVHTNGVPYALDVVFCDREWHVLHVETLPPMSRSKRVNEASSCVELLGGRAAQTGIVPGVRLAFGEVA